MKTNKPFNIRIGTKKSDDLNLDSNPVQFFDSKEKEESKQTALRDRLVQRQKRNIPNHELF